MPPGNVDMPSAALSILKSYLEHHGYFVKIIYWNIIILDFIKRNIPLNFRNKSINDISLLSLLPYLFYLNNKDAQKQQLLQNIFDEFLQNKQLDNRHELADLKAKIDKLIENKLNQILNEHPHCLFGISAKYSEWIYGLGLLKTLKQITTDTQIIIGGFTRKETALEFISINNQIDYCMYGESENSLLQLMKEINTDNPNFEEIPKLFYRKNKIIKQSNSNKLHKLDFREKIFPDYSDFFSTIKIYNSSADIKIQLPLDGTRGCSWNRCRFCVATQGIKYFERSAISLVDEMRHQYNKHGVSSFYTTDDDFNPKGSDRLLEISELLNKNSKHIKFNIETWLTPSNINYSHLKELSSACYLKIKSGLESTSDSLLFKMQKKNRFIENIILLKNMFEINPDFYITYSIIMGIPDESPDDVNSAIKNLDYLRFLISKNIEFTYNKFQLATGSYYHKHLSEAEKEEYKPDGFGIFAPEEYVIGERRFLFFFNTRKPLPNSNLWSEFKDKEKEIKTLSYTYNIDKSSNTFTEFTNKQIHKELILSNIEMNLLSLLNLSIINLTNLIVQMSPYTSSEIKIKKGLDNLLSHKLLYTDGNNYTSIINF